MLHKNSLTPSLSKQSQSAVPFLAHNTIFPVLSQHLAPAELSALAQTSQRGYQHLGWLIHNTLCHPEKTLHFLGRCSRKQAAKFFRRYRHQLESHVQQLMSNQPDNYAAHALHLMMCVVSRHTVDIERLRRTLHLLQKNHFPTRVIQSIDFIAQVLTTPPSHLGGLLPLHHSEFYINLRGASLGDAVLNHTDLTGADMRNACLMSTECRGAILNEADLQGAEISLVDFSDAELVNINLQETRIDVPFPYMPKFSQAYFFMLAPTSDVEKMKVLMKQQLDCYTPAAREHYDLEKAIVKDFKNKVLHYFTGKDRREMLQYALGHPAFTTHHEFILDWINRTFFEFDTFSQQKLRREMARLR